MCEGVAALRCAAASSAAGLKCLPPYTAGDNTVLSCLVCRTARPKTIRLSAASFAALCGWSQRSSQLPRLPPCAADDNAAASVAVQASSKALYTAAPAAKHSCAANANHATAGSQAGRRSEPPPAQAHFLTQHAPDRKPSPGKGRRRFRLRPHCRPSVRQHACGPSVRARRQRRHRACRCRATPAVQQRLAAMSAAVSTRCAAALGCCACRHRQPLSWM